MTFVFLTSCMQCNLETKLKLCGKPATNLPAAEQENKYVDGGDDWMLIKLVKEN